MITGFTFNIQRFSTEDGPGIRTTVFLKGCPLRCAWCHNPEGIRPGPELMWYDVRCIGARECLRACPVGRDFISPAAGQDEILSYGGALTLTPQGMRIDRARCTVCGLCAPACPTGALEVIGRPWSPDELLAEVLKDQVFYQTSGGGVTFSGGEPLMQADFLEQLLPRCQENGLHVAVDTCGGVSWPRYQPLLPWVDLVLLDLKIMDADRHQAATGVSNDLILANARRLAAAGKPLWIRTPIIPGYTADLANIQAIGRFIRDQLPTVQRWDLLAYTNLGRPKYHRLDRPYALEDAPLFTRQDMESLWQAAAELVLVAKWSGTTQ